MRPETRLAQWLLAAMFVVLGGERLWRALQGAAASDTVLLVSGAQLAIGIAIAAGWKLRVVAWLGALAWVADALLWHRFWQASASARPTELLLFMKAIGLTGGLILLAGAGGAKRR